MLDTMMKKIISILSFALVISGTPPTPAGTVRICPAPAGEELSKDYTVKVDGKEVPVYIAKVAPADPARRWKAMDDKANSADYFELASFAYFDMEDAVTVTVTCPEPIQSAKVLPSSFNIRPVVQGRSLTLTLPEPNPNFSGEKSGLESKTASIPNPNKKERAAG